MAKGGQFERDICHKLSLWWSGGKSDDIFWRTSGSGARATSRFKKGKATHGQHSDITHTHPSGAPFTDLFVTELKRGHNKTTLIEMIDTPKLVKSNLWWQWIRKVQNSVNASGAMSWLLIHKRDGREEMIFFPDLVRELMARAINGTKPLFCGQRVHYARCYDPCDHNTPPGLTTIYGMPLDEWLTTVTPDLVRKMATL